MAPKKKATMQSQEGERIAKLEYVVYDDIKPTLKHHSKQIEANTQMSKDIVNNLKSIKRICFASAISYAAAQVDMGIISAIIKILPF